MSPHRAWMVSVGLLLVVGLIGCGEKPQRIAQEPKPVADEPKSVAEKPEPVVGSTRPIVDEPEPDFHDPKLQESVREQAQECCTAFLEGDYARFVDLVYPKVVEGGGGRDKMIARLKSGVEDMTKGVTVRSVKVDVRRP